MTPAWHKGLAHVAVLWRLWGGPVLRGCPLFFCPDGATRCEGLWRVGGSGRALGRVRGLRRICGQSRSTSGPVEGVAPLCSADGVRTGGEPCARRTGWNPSLPGCGRGGTRPSIYGDPLSLPSCLRVFV